MSEMTFAEMNDLCNELIIEEKVEAVWTGDKEGLFVNPEFVPYYKVVYASKKKLSESSQKAYNRLKSGKKITARKTAYCEKCL